MSKKPHDSFLGTLMTGLTWIPETLAEAAQDSVRGSKSPLHSFDPSKLIYSPGFESVKCNITPDFNNDNNFIITIDGFNPQAARVSFSTLETPQDGKIKNYYINRYGLGISERLQLPINRAGQENQNKMGELEITRETPNSSKKNEQLIKFEINENNIPIIKYINESLSLEKIKITFTVLPYSDIDRYPLVPFDSIYTDYNPHYENENPMAYVKSLEISKVEPINPDNPLEGTKNISQRIITIHSSADVIDFFSRTHFNGVTSERNEIYMTQRYHNKITDSSLLIPDDNMIKDPKELKSFYTDYNSLLFNSGLSHLSTYYSLLNRGLLEGNHFNLPNEGLGTAFDISSKLEVYLKSPKHRIYKRIADRIASSQQGY